MKLLPNSHNILVTGATGYIGLNVSNFLAECGFNVIIIKRKESKSHSISKLDHKIKQLYYDGSLESITSVFKSENINFVIHFATYYSKESDYETFRNMEDILTLTAQVSTLSSSAEDFKGLINIGSVWELNLYHQNLYTRFKRYQEDLVSFYSETYKFKSLTLYLTDSYGPFDWRDKLFNIIINNYRKNVETVINSPNVLIELVHIDDIKSAIFHCIGLLHNQNISYTRYRIYGSEIVTIGDLVGLIESLLPNKMNLVINNTGISSNKSHTEIKPVNPILDWNPSISLKNGVTSTLKKEGLVK
jgi:nucleoside-diphosphate-sugar epimerase